MNRDETKKLLTDIVAIYPKFQVMTGTIEAWHRRLIDCTPQRAEELLDKWIEGDDSKFAPQLDYFVKGKNPVKVNIVRSDEKLEFHIGLRSGEYPPGGDPPKHVGKGCLFDQYGREYGSVDTDQPYFYDSMGRICNGLGQVIQE